MKNMKGKNNNGFTLVELMIAIAILAVIVGPFMHSFVTAARTNAKAQQIQNATLLATNIMEEVKANDVGDLAFQFNYPERSDAEHTSRFDVMSTYDSAYELIHDGETFQEVTKYQKIGNVDNRDSVTSSVLYEGYEANTLDEYEFLRQEDDKYYFAMEGLEAGASKYDALITLDAVAYKTEDKTGYNDMKTVAIETLDVLEDAFYVQSQDQDATYAEDLAEATGVLDYLTVSKSMERDITINIEKNGQLNRVYVTYEYTYSGKKKTVNHLIYNNSESPEYSLKSIYLFYVPLYNGKTEDIIINNPDNVDTNVYLIKQRIPSTNIASLQTNENRYRCLVSVKEGVSGFNQSTHKAHVSIRTNLGKNLYADTNEPQATYGYEGTGGYIATRQELIKKILNLNVLDGSEAKDRIFEVTVAIYKEGEADNRFAGSPVAKITGSKDN